MEGGGPMKGLEHGVFSYSSSNYLRHLQNTSSRLTKPPINFDGWFLSKMNILD